MKFDENLASVKKRPFRSDIPINLIIGEAMFKIVLSSFEDHTNNASSNNKMTKALDYLGSILLSSNNICDKQFIDDLAFADRMTDTEERNVNVWVAIIKVLDRKNLLIKSQKTERI